VQTVCTNSNLHYSLPRISSSAFAIICLYCSFTLSSASICTLPLKPNTQPKKAGLADTSVCTLKEVISYAKVVTSSPKRSTIVFIRLLSHRKSIRTFSPENIIIVHTPEKFIRTELIHFSLQIYLYIITFAIQESTESDHFSYSTIFLILSFVFLTFLLYQFELQLLHFSSFNLSLLQCVFPELHWDSHSIHSLLFSALFFTIIFSTLGPPSNL